ncbi:MAG: methionyl-tRNA formyltransferase, partial [Solobacterium sp.]|nr:methionyl-tRNA formyltransferase [Solobacterium sp.]
MEKPRIVFFGTPDFACAILNALAEEKYNVVAVVSQPDKPVGRKHRIEPVPVHALADELGIPVLQPVKLKDEVD